MLFASSYNVKAAFHVVPLVCLSLLGGASWMGFISVYLFLFILHLLPRMNTSSDINKTPFGFFATMKTPKLSELQKQIIQSTVKLVFDKRLQI